MAPFGSGDHSKSTVLCVICLTTGLACWRSSGTSMTGLNLLRPKQVSTATQNSNAGPGRKVKTGLIIFSSVQTSWGSFR